MARRRGWRGTRRTICNRRRGAETAVSEIDGKNLPKFARLLLPLPALLQNLYSYDCACKHAAAASAVSSFRSRSLPLSLSLSAGKAIHFDRRHIATMQQKKPKFPNSVASERRGREGIRLEFLRRKRTPEGNFLVKKLCRFKIIVPLKNIVPFQKDSAASKIWCRFGL